MKRGILQLVGAVIIAFVAGITLGGYLMPNQNPMFGGYQVHPPTILGSSTQEIFHPPLSNIRPPAATFTLISSATIRGAGFDGNWLNPNGGVQNEVWGRVEIDHLLNYFGVHLWGGCSSHPPPCDYGTTELFIDSESTAHATINYWCPTNQGCAVWTQWGVPLEVITLKLSLSADKSQLTLNTNTHYNWACLGSNGQGSSTVTVTYTNPTSAAGASSSGQELGGLCYAFGPNNPQPPYSPWNQPPGDQQSTVTLARSS